MEILKAFYYMFKGERWYLSIIAGALFYFPMLIIGIVLVAPVPGRPYEVFMALTFFSWLTTAVAMFFTTGYSLYNANLRFTSKEERCARWKSFKTILFTALKSLAAGWIYCLPLIFIVILTYITHMINVLELDGPFLPEKSRCYPIARTICTYFSLVLSILIPIAFITDLKFKTFFDVKKIWNIVRNNFGGFLIYLGFAAIDYFAYLRLPQVTARYPYITVPLVSFVIFYLLLVKSELLAQIARGAVQKAPSAAE